MPTLTCCLCGGTILEEDSHSTFRVEGECKGFSCSFDLRKAFHNACLTREEGVNEVTRAQVLDYIEAAQFHETVLEDLRAENLQRARRLLKQREWRGQGPEIKA